MKMLGIKDASVTTGNPFRTVLRRGSQRVGLSVNETTLLPLGVRRDDFGGVVRPFQETGEMLEDRGGGI